MLIRHIVDPDNVVAARCCQSLANVSEHPSSKEGGILRSEKTILTLKEVQATTQSDIVKTAAQEALNRILWEP